MFDPLPLNNRIFHGPAQELFGADVLFPTQVVNTTRTHAGVSVLVQDDAGTTTLIQPRGFFAAEAAVFSTFATSVLWVGVVRSNFIPDNTSVTFIPGADAPLLRFNHLVWDARDVRDLLHTRRTKRSKPY
ncbi:hypothetical protein K438DRAFT_1819402 [Mycena galopus ATCC 62051]|nr:hypothetical protein K438DRAFT_1819402 [Mycena galopus ATCC 62051]